MRIAVQGCSHGCLSQIYDSIAQYESVQSTKIDLLLLCGDFQALRSSHDFASLAVPPKYHQLGTFHEYYSGERVAPVLTLVIGGNHEASNYMWELYHGGWLAPNIYYLGAAGSVRVDGLRIMGASGIYKSHDYNKGHFETVPYNGGTLRSVYHIRKYDIERLKLLSPEKGSIALSHDWPTTIPRYGDTKGLLRRKPFFKEEVEADKLGSPPLLDLLQTVKPDYWFSAHLHVKFAAVFEHRSGGHKPSSITNAITAGPSTTSGRVVPQAVANPDEIDISDDFDVESPLQATKETTMTNPDEITIDDDFEDVDDEATTQEQIVYDAKGTAEVVKDLEVDESADLVEQARKEGEEEAAKGVIGTTDSTALSVTEIAANEESDDVTKFLALDKCGPGKDFIQYLEIPSPEPVSPEVGARLTFDREWLAITRALHPYLSLEIASRPLPPPQQIKQLIADELTKIQQEGLLVPKEGVPEGQVELIWDCGEIEVNRVQKFWPTAPSEGQPGGSASAWYTNPQTEALCGMLGIPNRINPAPP